MVEFLAKIGGKSTLKSEELEVVSIGCVYCVGLGGVAIVGAVLRESQFGLNVGCRLRNKGYKNDEKSYFESYSH